VNRSIHIASTTMLIGFAACMTPPDVDDVEHELAATYKAQVKNRTLSIVGNTAAAQLALRLGATPDILQVDVGADGSADFEFSRATFERIVVDAAGGNDVVRIDESAGAFTSEEQVTIDGGSGDDTLLGGSGPETLSGGAGNDSILGGYGADMIVLGAGDDTVVWDPGGGSDTVEGNDGTDTLQLHLANIGEQVELRANGDRLRLTRDVAAIGLDLHGLEIVDLTARGGADRITVGDLGDALVAQVNVDLESAIAGQGDAQADAVVLAGTPDAADTVEVWRDGAAVVAAGRYTEVRVSGAELALDRLIVEGEAGDRVEINGSPSADVMTAMADATGILYDGGGFGVLVAPSAAATVTLHGLGGDDTISATGGITAPLAFDGGDGNDQISGSYGADRLVGGPGDDVVDGNAGPDNVSLGDGDDLYLWDPGDASDVIDGEGGRDALIFTAANIGDAIDLRASGARVALFRNVGSATLDLDGVERFDIRARGGADTIVIDDLSGTAATDVNLDLAYDGANGDGQIDAVVVDGEIGVDTIHVAAADGAVTATGLGAAVHVQHGEPALDRMTVHGGVLNIDGSDGADTMTVVADASGPLYDGGDFGVLVAAGAVTEVRVNGRGGDDSIGTSGSVTSALILDGGDGDDTIRGGAGPDLLLGGAGNDLVDGNMGADTAQLGAGDDSYLWDPGDSSDLVDGELGADTLVFRASNASDTIDVRASGNRAAVSRNIGATTTDLGGVERIDLAARGGGDLVTIWDLTGTPVAQVDVDLALVEGSPPGDGLLDVVAVVGSPLDDLIAIAGDPGGVAVTGLPAVVRIAHPDATDELRVFGAAGLDGFSVAPGLDTLIALTTYQD